MPLVPTSPIRFGADEFCSNCQVCTQSCPPGAIASNKQMVRGVERWYVNFDKCIPYFAEAASCGICIAECPWTRPVGAPKTSSYHGSTGHQIMMTATLAQSDRRKIIHYAGWGVLAAAFTGVMVSFAPIVPYTFSLFLDPLHPRLAGSAKPWAQLLRLAAITVALVSPAIGLLARPFSSATHSPSLILVFALRLPRSAGSDAAHPAVLSHLLCPGLVANGTAQFAYTSTILTWFTRAQGLPWRSCSPAAESAPS